MHGAQVRTSSCIALCLALTVMHRVLKKSKSLGKVQCRVQERDVCKYVAVVEKGLLRSYTINDKGQEHINQFAFEGWWIADQFSFLTREPSKYNIEAMEDCELLLLSKSSED